MIAFELGACHEINLDVSGAETDVHQAVERARARCNRCPGQLECLAFALRIDGLEGIWGGMTPAERKRCAHADFGSVMHRR